METKKQPITMKSVMNPTSETLNFIYDSAEYILPAGEKKEFVSYVADLAAKKLADKNTMTTNPDEHKVLMGAYLENSEPEVIAKGLGIDLVRIRKEAMTKEKEKARVVNLEAQVMEQNRKIDMLVNRIEEVQAPVKEPKVEKEKPKVVDKRTNKKSKEK